MGSSKKKPKRWDLHGRECMWWGPKPISSARRLGLNQTPSPKVSCLPVCAGSRAQHQGYDFLHRQAWAATQTPLSASWVVWGTLPGMSEHLSFICTTEPLPGPLRVVVLKCWAQSPKWISVSVGYNYNWSSFSYPKPWGWMCWRIQNSSGIRKFLQCVYCRTQNTPLWAFLLLKHVNIPAA